MLQKEKLDELNQNKQVFEQPQILKEKEDLLGPQFALKENPLEEIKEGDKQNDDLLENKEAVKQLDLSAYLNKSEQRAEEFKQYVGVSKSIKKFKVSTLPSKSALLGEYKGRSKNLDLNQRAAKIKNKRSRLFKKAQYYSALGKAAETATKKYYDRAAEAASDNKRLSLENARDLSYFMETDDEEVNAELVTLYSGTNEIEATAQDRVAALDKITATLLKADVSKISLENDKDIAKNSEKLEKITGMVGAYDRLLSENPDYAESLKSKEEGENSVFAEVTKRLEMLRAVACYYVARKELINNKYYREHYNDELSIDVDENATEDRKEVAKLLLNSYYAGVHLMKVGGATQKALDKMAVPELKGSLSREYEKNAKEIEESEEKRKKLLSDYHKKTDETATDLYDQIPKGRELLVKKGKEIISNSTYTLEELDKSYKEPDLKDLDKEISDFKNIDINLFKFGSYREILENYDHNMNLARKADKVQTLIAKALISGKKFKDSELIKLRAKIVAFNEIRNVLYTFTEFFKVDSKRDGVQNYEKSFDKWDSFFINERLKFGREDYTALPCKNMNDFYKKCLKQITKEHNDREETIGNTRKLLGGVDNELPKGLVRQKMAEYQTNAFIADYLAAQNDKILAAKAAGDNIATKYIKEHPEEFSKGFSYGSLPREGGDFLAGRSEKDTIRLLKLYAGHKSDKPGSKEDPKAAKKDHIKFWLEFYREYMDVKPEDYEMKDLNKFFTGFTRKAVKAVWLANCEKIGNNIRMLATELGDDAFEILFPNEQELSKEERLRRVGSKADEIYRNTHILKSFAQAYISGRVQGLTQGNSTKYRHTVSLEDMCGGINKEAATDVSDLTYESQQELGLLNEEQEKYLNVRNRLAFTQIDITTRVIDKENLVYESVNMDTDFTRLYKEEAAAYDFKVFTEKYGNEDELKEKVNKYDEDYKEYLKENEAAKELDALFKVDTKDDKKEDMKKTVSRIESVFEKILSFNPGDFNFDSYEKLFDKKSFELRQLSDLGSGADEMLSFYETKVQDRVLTDTDLATIKARIEFLKTAKNYYGGNSREFLDNAQKPDFTPNTDLKSVLDEKRKLIDKNRGESDEAVRMRAIDKIQQNRYRESFTLGSEFFEELSKSDTLTKNLKGALKNKTGSLQESINKLQAVMLYTTVPAPGTKNARQIIDGTCNLVTICYTEIENNLNSIKEAIENKTKAFPAEFKALKDSLDATIARCRADREMFPQKAADYFELMSQKKEAGGEEPKWMEVLKFTRAEFYDTNKEGVTLKKTGANLSDISMIKSKETGKTIFFRREDFAPKEKVEDSINDTAKQVFGEVKDKSLALSLEEVGKRFLKSPDTDYDSYRELSEKIAEIREKIGKEDKKSGKTYSSIDAADEIMSLVAKNALFSARVYQDSINEIFKKDTLKAGQYFISLNMLLYKRDNCFGDDPGSRYYNRSAKIRPGRNLSNRHVATSRFAQLMGIGHMVSASRTATVKIGDELVKGNLMEDSGGEEIFDIVEKQKDNVPSYSTEAIKQSLVLQVFDYLIGHTDRHFGNFHVLKDEKTNTITALRAIDNDMCWGLLKPEDMAEGFRHLRPLDNEVLKGLPASFINMIFSITRENAAVMLGDIVESDELSAFMERVKYIQENIRALQNNDNDDDDDIVDDDGEQRVDMEVVTNELKVNSGTVITSETVRFKQSDDLRALRAVKALMEKVNNQNMNSRRRQQTKDLENVSYLYSGLFQDGELDKRIEEEKKKVS